MVGKTWLKNRMSIGLLINNVDYEQFYIAIDFWRRTLMCSYEESLLADY